MATLNLKLKVAVVQPKKKSYTIKRISKIVQGVVIEENGNYKVSIDLDKNGEKDPLILDFTPTSFDLIGRTTVFLRKKDEHGNTVRIIRDDWHAKFLPGLPEQYTPFAKNWIVKGYVVKDGNKSLFDFKDLVGINGYNLSKIPLLL